MSGSVLWTSLHFGRWRAELWKLLTFCGYMWTLVYFSICGWGRESISLSVIGDRERGSLRGPGPLRPLHSSQTKSTDKRVLGVSEVEEERH